MLNRFKTADEAHLSLDEAISKATKGMAVVHPATPIPRLEGRICVVVHIADTNTLIAICGDSGAPDEAEAIANANLIAHAWNCLAANHSICLGGAA